MSRGLLETHSSGKGINVTTDPSPSNYWFLSLAGGAIVIYVLVKILAVMSAKKKAGAVKLDLTPKRVKKVRSISVSVDLEGYDRSKSKLHSYYTRSSDERFRTISASVTAAEYGEQFLGSYEKVGGAGPEVQRWHRALFPLQDLPDDCKLKIFQFLSPAERGLASQVCREWNFLMKSSSLWSTVDFTQFPLCYDQTHDCGKICYLHYRSRIRNYIKYLQSVRPGVKRLLFAFDIDDHEDNWLDDVESLLKSARLHELEFAHLNWAETEKKPYWGNANITWTASDYNALKFKNRHRQRKFVKFFDMFTAAAPNIRKLILPFDWSPRSLQALGRLSHLDTLVLCKYFENQQLPQDSLDQLLRVTPQLQKLILEVWTPSGKGLSFFTIRSPSLPYLDISQCRGFYVGQIDMPSVKVFKVGPGHPLKGSMSCSEQVHVPCIYQLLVHGAPKLIQLNDHILKKQWRWSTYPELDIVLNTVCLCRQHKKDFARSCPLM